ncbi:MAG: hypothetical protein M1812_007370 [Candelaria pacifica]|nr:MAG: hypothetical protein M1812_007370 [Candelaria pacifica]
MVALTGLAVTVEAYWRLPCSLIQTGRIDPVINPGMISPHVHKIVGASNINPNSTYDTLQTAGCTSCSIQADKSAYWAPQLYYNHPNGTYEEVGNSGMTVYYLGRGDNRTNAIPFPPGFRMSSGDNFARSFNYTAKTYLETRPIADRVTFACLDYNHPTPEHSGLNQTKCPDGLRAQVHFQSCWNGKDLYVDDNSQRHVAYMSGIDNGVCPPTHPVQLLHLFFEVLYSMDSVTQSDGGHFTFSNGDPTGYGWHGVFINGWDIPTLTSAIKTCAYNEGSDGNIGACPVLQASVDDNYDTTCPPRAQLINEPTRGLIAAMPGCNVQTFGPEPATDDTQFCPPGSPLPSINKIDTSKTPKPVTVRAVGAYQSLGCYTDNNTYGRALNGPRFSDTKNMTVENCVTFCENKNFAFAGLEYAQECYCGRSLSFGSKACDAQSCNMPCKGNSSQVCGAGGELSVYQKGGKARRAASLE